MGWVILAFIALVMLLFFCFGYILSSMASMVGFWVFVGIIALIAIIVYIQDN
ncbi:MAG: hypothetical protein HUJ91_04105 [Bacteroidales bacterium]|nr:hypothetical protein [Bacteroidales bacterium]